MTTLSDKALAHLRTLGSDAVPRAVRYEVLEELGRGGMGVVYRVRDRQLGRDAAMKVVGDDLPDTALARLQREAEILALLEHPGIVPVHDVGTLADGRPYYVMKLVQGETLEQRLVRGIALPEGLRLFARLCETMAFAHARGVIHRDLTPRNIMLGPFGDVLVVDWGVAKRDGADGRTLAAFVTSGAGERATRDGAVIGTAGYMAPEQNGQAAEVDARADIFALGRVLRDIVGAATGDSGPAPLRSVIAHATAPLRGGRYRGADLMAADVLAWLDRLPVAAHREGLFERAGRVVRRHRVAVALLLVYLVVRLLMLVVTLR